MRQGTASCSCNHSSVMPAAIKLVTTSPKGMDPVVDGGVGEPSVGVHVIARLRVDHRLMREVRGEEARLAIGGARGVIENVGGWMALGEIERSTRTQQRCDDLRPSNDVGQPADGAPGDEHHVEPMGRWDRRQRVIEVRMNKARAVGETEFASQLARQHNGWRREIEADDLCAALRQC